MPFGLGFFAVAGAGGAAGSFDLLETQVLTGAQASVVFSNLNTNYGSTYKHLQIRMLGRTTRAVSEDGATRIWLNGDTTAANYRAHFLVGTGSNVVSYDSGNNPELGSFPGANAGSGQFAAMVIDLPDPFTSDKNKTMRMLAGLPGSFNSIRLHSAVRFNTAATTQIDINATAGNWAIGSRFSLYGIKGA